MLRPAATRILPLLLAAFLAATLSACGGGSSDSPSSASEADASPEASGSAGSTAESTSIPAEADASLFDALDEGDAALPAGSESVLGGTPYYAAADAIKQTLEENGVPLDGMEVYVLPIRGTDTSLLVFEADLSAPASEGETPADITPALSMLVDSEAVQSANVTRVVLNLRGEDEQGPIALTITMPLESLPAMIEGTLSDEESTELLRIGVQRQ